MNGVVSKELLARTGTLSSCPAECGQDVAQVGENGGEDRSQHQVGWSILGLNW